MGLCSFNVSSEKMKYLLQYVVTFFFFDKNDSCNDGKSDYYIFQICLKALF